MCLDLLPSTSMNHTYRNYANGITSWTDHFICDDALAAKDHYVVPLYCSANLSDHVPITVAVDLPVNALTPDFVIGNFAISNTEINDHTD